MTDRARDPRTSYPVVDKCALSARLASLDAARLCLVQCMPPYDLSKEMDAVRSEILGRYPECVVEYVDRRDFLINDPAERQSILDRADAAILFVGPSSSSLYVHWQFGIGLERGGLPVGLVVPAPLEAGARYEEQMRGAKLRWALAPDLGATATARHEMASTAVDSLVRPLIPEEAETGPSHPLQVEDYVSEGTPEQLGRDFQELGLTDGLPIVVPTDDLVEAMLAGTSRQPGDIVCATLRPEGLPTSVEKVAINAVMAGARPEHLPVILAAVSLYGHLQLESMTRSLNGFAFTHLVNGPIVGKLAIEGGTNALGRGNPINAVLERAVGLVLQNCGHQHFGVNSNPVMGSPVGIKFVAENEAESPWGPLHETLGFEAEDNAISLFVGGQVIVGNFNFGGLGLAAEELKRFDNKTGALLLVSAKRASELATEGMSRAGVVDELWSGATAPLGEIRQGGFYSMMKNLIARGGDNPLWPKDYLTRPDEDVVPLYPKSGLHVAVVGSTLGSIMQLWSAARLESASIDDWV